MVLKYTNFWSPPPSPTFFQSPPFGCLKIFGAPLPQYLHPPLSPRHIGPTGTFYAHIQQLPDVKRVILERQHECVTHHDRLLYMLSRGDGPQVYNVSDGGVMGSTGSFGWIIGTMTDELWKNKGPAHGWPMQSFRAESVGMMSLLWFYEELITFYNLSLPEFGMRFYSDNKTLIDRLLTLLEYDGVWYPSVFAWPDIDTTQEIFISLGKLPFWPSFKHVKGHQDEEIPFEQLRRPAQLNVLADHLATAALQEQDFDEDENFYPLPHMPMYLKLEGRFVCSRERNLLRDAIPRVNVANYFKDRYDWPDNVFEQVDWTAFEAARKRTPSTNTFTTKLVTGWLATNAKLAQWEKMPATCPFCGHHSETNDHLFQCPQRNQWRAEFKDKLSTFLVSQQTKPELTTCILRGVDRAFDPKANQHRQVHQHDGQQDIGWHRLMRGFVSAHFSRVQEGYLVAINNNGRRKWTANEWQIRLIRFIWTEMQSLWKARSDIVHRRTELHASLQDRIRAEARVTVLYQQQSSVGYLDQDIFGMPLVERLRTSTTRDLFAWAANMEPAIRMAQRNHTTRSQANTQDIRTFFQRLTPVAARPRRPRADHSMTSTTGNQNHPS